MDNELVYWAWLAAAFGASNPAKWSIISDFISPKDCYEAVTYDDKWLSKCLQLRGFTRVPLYEAERIVEYCLSRQIDIISFSDRNYPERLRQITNPPAALFCRGDFSGIDNSVVIACVGTRTPSDYSVRITNRICSEMAAAGAVIASGAAEGLDSYALSAAIEGGGRAVCVLPCGIEYNGPAASSDRVENEEFKNLIVENGGAVISEYFPDKKSSLGSFRARNRILTGISTAVLITQAGDNSGALSTADLAIAQSRDLYCIPPHELYDDSYSGAVQLIRGGAVPVFDSSDLLNEYISPFTHRMLRNTGKTKVGISDSPPDTPEKKPEAGKARNKTIKEDDTSQNKQIKPINTDGMSEENRKVIEFISENGTVLFDTIAQELPEIEDLEFILTMLEIDGIIKSLSGNRYTI